MTTVSPPSRVLSAFGLSDAPRRMPGGQGTSWVCQGLVLKPGAGWVEVAVAEALSDIDAVGFRLAEPVLTTGGGWICEGWAAHRIVSGDEADLSDPHDQARVLGAGRAFHRAVAHLTRPDCLADRQDWWARADRIAWGEERLRFDGLLDPLVCRLTDALEPLGTDQLVHGDLTGNVLISPHEPPAVVDVSPYWRPVAYAEGVVVADLLTWWGAPAGLAHDCGVSTPAVARALLFRMATAQLMADGGVPGVDLEAEAHRHERAAAALGL